MRGSLGIDIARITRLASGFTLVELLAVIAIVAVLMAVLIPVLDRAREAANRANCLSNLREINVAVHLYAQANDDRVPIGYRGGNCQWDSMIYSATSHHIVLMGLLYAQGLMRQPRGFFCQSESDPQSMFDTSINPWPPPPAGNTAMSIYAGYCSRAQVNIPDDFSTPSAQVMPRLAQFSNEALISDLFAIPMRVDTRHRMGINVLYANGSARWVERGVFDDELAQCPAISSAYNAHQTAIWNILDQQ